jgi:hypothetical protein
MPKFEFNAEFLCEIEADLSVPEMVGPVPEGVRTTFYIDGGTFEGPDIKGIVKPVGADWFLLRPDGVGELDVRTTLETDDGELIYVYYTGLVDIAAQGLEGATILTNPVFRTSSEKYAWLNKTFAVGVGAAGDNKVSYSIYKLS